MKRKDGAVTRLAQAPQPFAKHVAVPPGHWPRQSAGGCTSHSLAGATASRFAAFGPAQAGSHRQLPPAGGPHRDANLQRRPHSQRERATRAEGVCGWVCPLGWAGMGCCRWGHAGQPVFFVRRPQRFLTAGPGARGGILL